MLPALLLTSAALLVVSGSEKLLRPRPAAQALLRAGVPAPVAAARLVALGELVAGGTALVVGGRVGALAVAATYAGFTAFLASRWVAGELGVPCGCFGDDSPLGPVHLGIDVVAVVVGVIAAATVEPGLLDVLGDDGVAAGVATAAMVGSGAALLRGLLATLPATRLEVAR